MLPAMEHPEVGVGPVETRLEPVGAGSPRAAAVIEELLRSGFEVRVEVTGESMRPLLRGGETVTVGCSAPESLVPGELVLCRAAGGRLVLHRLVSVSGAGAERRWRTRGDALMSCDEPFAERQVLGKVTRIEGLRLPLAPPVLDTGGRCWLAASRGIAATACAGRLARRLGARLRRTGKSLTFRSNSRKVQRPLWTGWWV